MLSVYRFAPRVVGVIFTCILIVLLMLMLFVILEPQCCEYTCYYSNIIGLRLRSDGIPPH